MTTIPTSVTLDQRRAACRALGLPPALVQSLTVRGDGATAALYVLDREGRRISHSGAPLTATVSIPLAEEVSST
ncbi:hypothetical protein [Streptomyces sp. NPDC096323]|uniref:hypothetical protein n=1 Tax=Streptomyces sp. NPDC096323 TaxID=3155822 RepID=UPI00331E32F8